MSDRAKTRPRVGVIFQIAAGLRFPAMLALLLGLGFLVFGVATMPASVTAEADVSTATVGAPAYAAIVTSTGPVPGRWWLIAGTVATVIGGVSLLALLGLAARRRPAVDSGAGGLKPIVGARRRSPLAVAWALLGIGVVLLVVGLLEVPRDALSQLNELLPSDSRAPDDLSLPISVPGRGSLDTGTALVAFGAAGLLASGLGRRRIRARPAPVGA